ncbi:hypothetical protein [Chromobacterium haemolyticum]|uniref:hypothetical protein n=1 Tax=Chromobacterium haemolyticum TaxID=394935 RepID=UPI0005933B9C|nr:hypothetical protein [Chromobacterium haemolyticum]
MTELENQLLAVLRECDEAMAYMSEYDIPLTLPDRVKEAIAAAEATSLQPTVAVVPDFPGRLSIADLDYAQKLKPESWSDEHFETWQLLQVASRNVTRLHIYARQLRSMLEAAPPATVKDSLIVQQAPGVPDDARECLLDVVSHHHDFAEAVQRCADIERENGDDEDVGYWKHQADVLDRMKGQAERALATAPSQVEQQAPDKWQPISTAPKNGMHILCYMETDFGGHMEPMYWSDGCWNYCLDGDYCQYTPSHWMPAPPAPTQGAAARLAAEAKGGSDANH